MAKDDNFLVTFLVADNLPDEVKNNVQIKSIGKSTSRLNRMLSFPIKMLKKAKAENADSYHIHDPELFWLILLLKRKNKKVIFDLHEDLPSQILSKPYINPIARKGIYWLAKLYEKLLLPKAAYVFTATPFIRDINKRYNQKIGCLSNFPIASEFKNDEKATTDLKQRAICYTGGITTIRGVGFLIDSVLQSDDDWILHLAGPIGDAEIKLKLETALVTTNRIKYWGNVDRLTLKEIFNISSAGFVTFLPVPNHINAVPNKLFEYMSSGLPVICSSFKYWKEVINENNVGIVVEPTNVTEIIDSVNFIFNNPNIAAEWGRNGIKAVGTKYNWEAESQKLINTYRNL